jgi:tetraacyldisaccharide 4'-kinase
MSLDARLQRLWYGPAWRSLPLWPLEWIFRLLVGSRRLLYRVGLLRTYTVPVPVIVVGNLTVGGTGKTPVAAWLARQFTLRGHRVGVVLRGYGGSHGGAPRVVGVDDEPSVVGDEALVHARRRPHVVVIGADRVAAAELAAEEGAEVVVCDDGLQHARLARDYEVAVVDAVRGLGNGHLLPAGPLREPRKRLEQVDAVVITERRADGRAECRVRPRSPIVVEARFALGDAVSLLSGERRTLAQFNGAPVHAIAAIGHPQPFFAALRGAGLTVTAHALPDHGDPVATAQALPRDTTVLMTEKDAVKCAGRAQPGWWWVDLDVGIDRASAEQWLARVLERTRLTGAGVQLG